jgi:hypothetical protein
MRPCPVFPRMASEHRDCDINRRTRLGTIREESGGSSRFLRGVRFVVIVANDRALGGR